MRFFVRLCAIGFLGMACAGTPKRTESSSARLKDSAPEKVAAQKNATPGLRLESEDERFGIEAAKQRKREQEEARAAKAPAPAAKGMQVTPAPATPP